MTRLDLYDSRPPHVPLGATGSQEIIIYAEVNFL